MFENYKIKKITKNLGSIEERQDCIICTIDNNKLDDHILCLIWKNL